MRTPLPRLGTSIQPKRGRGVVVDLLTLAGVLAVGLPMVGLGLYVLGIVARLIQ